MKATSIALIAALALAGCARPGAPETGGSAASPAAARPSPSRSPAFRAAQVPPTNIKQLRVLPADAQPGTAYPFDLYTHCGLEFAEFAGSAWRARQPIRTGLPGYVAGTMELLESGQARFVIDRRHFAAPVDFVIFQRTSESVPHCK